MASHPVAYADPAPAAVKSPVGPWRETLSRGRDALRDRFFASPDTPALLREHARLVDKVLRGIWNECAMPRGLSLVAVGGRFSPSAGSTPITTSPTARSPLASTIVYRSRSDPLCAGPGS